MTGKFNIEIFWLKSQEFNFILRNYYMQFAAASFYYPKVFESLNLFLCLHTTNLYS